MHDNPYMVGKDLLFNQRQRSMHDHFNIRPNDH